MDSLYPFPQASSESRIDLKPTSASNTVSSSGGLGYATEEEIHENIGDHPSVIGKPRDCRIGESPASQHDADHPRLDQKQPGGDS